MPGADTGGPLRFIVVEFLNGGTLADRSKRLMDSNPGGSEPCNRIFAGFPARELFVHLRDLSSVLSYLHGAGHERELSQRFIMHRDLKSANIAFHTPTASADSAPKLKLLDLGLARRVRRAPHQTPRTGTYKQTYPLTPKSGTFRYMSPEIAAGGQYNASADVYSFACVARARGWPRRVGDRSSAALFFSSSGLSRGRWPRAACRSRASAPTSSTRKCSPARGARRWATGGRSRCARCSRAAGRRTPRTGRR